MSDHWLNEFLHMCKSMCWKEVLIIHSALLQQKKGSGIAKACSSTGFYII